MNFKYYISLFAFLCFALTVRSQQITLDYAKQLGGTVSDIGVAIALDDSGNVWSTGIFLGNVDLDPDTGTSLFSSFGSSDVYISKLDSLGNFLWGGQIGGLAGEGVTDMTIDPSGAVYITGSFQGTCDFDPGVGTFNLSSTTGSDMFVLKLHNNGSFAWAKAWDCDGGMSITSDTAASIYAAGVFSSTFDADPNAGVQMINTQGVDDYFIVKLDSGGNFKWVVAGGGTSFDRCNSLVAAQDGSIYAAGYFSGTVDFNPGPGIFTMTSNGGEDIFILKLDSAGVFQYVKQAGGSADDFSSAITLDPNQNIYCGGQFSGTVDFDPGAGTLNLTSLAGTSAFFWKLDLDGDLIWAKQSNVEPAERSKSLFADGDENLYVTGHFLSTIDIDPGSGVLNLTSFGSNDPYLLKLDAQGNMIWAAHFGSSGNDCGIGIAVGPGSDIYSTGFFSDTAEMDPNGAGVFLTADLTDTYIMKLNQCRNATVPVINPPAATICSGDSVQLNIASGNLNDASNWYWYSDSCGGTPVDSGSSITVSPTTSTAYFVRAEGGCHQVDTCEKANITVNPSPVIELGNDAIICHYNMITLNAGPGYSSYSWSDGSTSQSILLDGNVLGPGSYTYSVMVSDSNNCMGIDSIEITVEICFGIKDIESSAVKCYPNPADAELIIELDENINISELFISNMKGQIIYHQSLEEGESNSLRIDISAIAAGQYLLQVMDKTAVYSARFNKSKM